MKHVILFLVLIVLSACGGGSSTQPASTTTYTLSFVSGGSGTLSGTTSQVVSQGASSSTVIAVPESGYHFVSWTEGGNEIASNAALTVANVRANHNYTANFAINTQTNTTATYKIVLDYQADQLFYNIAGVSLTLTLPANVTPAVVNGSVDAGAVTPSGTFSGGIQTPPIYTPATATTPGALKLAIANSNPDGVVKVREVATIKLQVANGAVPSASSFGLSTVSVIDNSGYNKIGREHV